MQRIGVIILMACCFSFIQAQTIHWITFIDTTDPNVGQIDVNTRGKLYSKFINVVNEALRGKGYKAQIHDYYGYNVSPSACKNAITSLSCKSKDIIVFYYIGHGGRPAKGNDYNKKNPWPQMCMAQNDQSKYIPLHWVHQELKKKGAALTVTIGMCCNSVSPRISHKDEPEFLSKKNRLISKDYAKRIQNWFMNYKGDVEITSATATQTSGCYDFGTWGVMDLFSGVVCQLMDNYSTAPGNITWNSFLKDVKYWCKNLSGGEQTPYYVLNISPK